MAKSFVVFIYACLLVLFNAATGFSADLFPQYTKEQKIPIYGNIPFQNVETFLSRQAFQDLKVSELFQAIDRTHLASGSYEFFRLLHPTDSMEKLQNRRALLLELQKNENELFAELETAFNHFGNEQENLFISLIDRNILPDISAGMELASGIIEGLFSILSISHTKRHIMGDIAGIRTSGWLNRILLGHSFLIEALGGFFLAHQAYTNINSAGETVAEVDQFVLQFARAIDTLNHINQIIQSSPVLARSFPAFSDFLTLSKEHPNLSWTLRKLEERLKAEDSNWRYWSMKDSILVYDAIRELRTELANVLWWTARLDAYLSVIRWVNEMKEKHEAITMADFNLEAKRASFQFTALKNMAIQDSTSNDFNLNGHAIITGPHACGKTSSMRSIAYAHIMAQSILFVPAQKAEIAPIYDLKTYFNVGDSNEESSFEAEYRRINELQTFAKQSDPKKPILFLIDEPYAKTTQRIGNRMMNQFLPETIHIPNLSMILSSHLEAPAQLAKENPELLQNWQPQVDTRNDDFRPSYKIIPGSADWWFQDQNQTDQYLDWFIRKKTKIAERS